MSEKLGHGITYPYAGLQPMSQKPGHSMSYPHTGLTANGYNYSAVTVLCGECFIFTSFSRQR